MGFADFFGLDWLEIYGELRFKKNTKFGTSKLWKSGKRNSKIFLVVFVEAAFFQKMNSKQHMKHIPTTWITSVLRESLGQSNGDRDYSIQKQVPQNPRPVDVILHMITSSLFLHVHFGLEMVRTGLLRIPCLKPFSFLGQSDLYTLLSQLIDKFQKEDWCWRCSFATFMTWMFPKIVVPPNHPF